MPREIALLDALVPTLLFAFLAAGFAIVVLDWIFSRYNLYRHIWYPALFRFALFVCMFTACGLFIY